MKAKTTNFHENTQVLTLKELLHIHPLIVIAAPPPYLHAKKKKTVNCNARIHFLEEVYSKHIVNLFRGINSNQGYYKGRESSIISLFKFKNKLL